MGRTLASQICCLMLGCVALLLPALLGCSKNPPRTFNPPVTIPSPSASAEADEPAERLEPGAESLIQAILSTARSQLGKVYRWGGSSPEEGFDCSGFVQWVFAQHGIALPRSSREQISAGTPVAAGDLEPGDLVFYSGSVGSKRPHHVGIYAGAGQFIHSPRTGQKIRKSPVFSSYFSPRFLSGRRVAAGAGYARLQGDSDSQLDEKPADSEDTPSYYVVLPGDYVWKIARKLGVSPHALLELNNLKPESIIRVGQRLLIPDKKGGS